MATGLLALLDDVAGLAKVAAASLDDVALQAAKSGVKAAGVVIDDAAVTPRYVIGFAAERELPIVAKIATGSLKNKLIYLLPAALVLSLVAPWAITPLLMIGGAYLCYEGAEKVFEALFPHRAHHHGVAIGAASPDPETLEDEKVHGAIRTDFILSAEIMAIALGSVAESSYWMQAVILAVVGIGITVLVYGSVAFIVKADDVGVALAANERPVSGLTKRGGAGAPTHADRIIRPLTQNLGRSIVYGMPLLLTALSVIGTAAMIWVGGGIIVHGLETYGLGAPAHTTHNVAEAGGHAIPALAGTVEWVIEAAAHGVLGLVLGFVLIPFIERIATPVVRRVKNVLGRRGGARRGDENR